MYNYHTHTYRCHHAVGDDRDYVLAAIENGYTQLGFSDHAPYIFPEGFESTLRMETNKAEEYVNSIKELQTEFKDKIDIKIGFELEYYPDLFDKELEFLKSVGYDYLILGQHFLGNESDKNAIYSGKATIKKEKLTRYTSLVLEAVKTNNFLYVAHPDLINFKGRKSTYIEVMTDFITQLKEYDIPLEFNFLGFSDGRQYHNVEFWNIVSKVQNRVVLGLDAHDPAVFYQKEKLQQAYNVLDSLNLKVEDSLF